jgi:predicted nuclease of predicted toxin-antitoxin system
MADPIRFYLDENMHGGLAPGLRARGIDAVSAREVGRLGLPDPDQLAFATSEGRVLVTYDQDYLALHASGVSHTGIAWCHPSDYSVGQLIDALVLVHGAMTVDEMVNHVEYL